MSTEHIFPPYDDDKFIHANIVSPGDVAQTSGEELQKSCTPAIHLLHAYQYISVRDGISLDSVHSRVKCHVEKSMTNSPAATINEYHPTAVSEIKSGSSDKELLFDDAATAKPGSPKGHLSAAASEYLPSIVSGIKPGLSKGLLFDDAANADEYPHITVSEIILGSSGKWVLIDDAATAKAESYKGLLSDDAAAANEYLPSIVSGIQPGPSKGLLFDDAATTDEYPRSIVPEIISGSSGKGLLIDDAAIAKAGSSKGLLSDDVAAANEYLPSIVSGIKPESSKGLLFDDAANVDEYPHITVSEIISGSSGKQALIYDAATAKAESSKGLLSDDAAAANEYLPNIVSEIKPGSSKGLVFDDATTNDEYLHSIVSEIISGSCKGHLSDEMNIPELDMSFPTVNPIEYFTNYLDIATTDEAYQFQGSDNQVMEIWGIN
ncbi:hypothetical protein SUGI_0139570 [Cryptomeria japonica]|nr:hypothetical protein SUGI_0139570 [Cryptomeria japonica]